MKWIQQKLKERFPEAAWLDDVQYVYVLAALVFIVALALLTWFIYGARSQKVIDGRGIVEPDAGQEAVDMQEDCMHRRSIDGICVSSPTETDPRVVAVMIENAADAWPLYGIADAHIVYEALVEGNIPRYMAFFIEDTDVLKVGPVRSSRPYYLDWLQEYPNAMYMHVGGSPEALQILQTSEHIFSVNEFYRGWFYWRDTQRAAPHNVFTSKRLWKRAWNAYGPEIIASPESWKFDAQPVCEEHCALSVDVLFSSALYNVTWDFVSSTGQYERSQGRGKDRDADGTQIVADTVIVQFIPSAVIDAVGRKRMETIGEGRVIIFQQGHVLEGVWKKDSPRDRTQFTDDAGNTIPLKPGKIWVEIVPTGADVRY